MTTIVRVNDLAKEWNGKRVFEDVYFEINAGERLAVFGANGAGKTTLFEILVGETEPSDGLVERRLPLADWGYMQQTSDIELRDFTVLEAAGHNSGELWEIKRKLRVLEAELGSSSSEQGEEMLEEYGTWMDRYEGLGGFQWEFELEKHLTMLNIGPDLWSLPFAQLSGGQKTRVRLASILVRRPKFLLLDEPTNHLDEASILWLEKWLTSYDGTVLFVSHDRTFLDQVATGIVELKADGAKKYKGGYTDYRREKERELREQETLYKKQQLAREALEESIRRYQQWFNKADRNASQNNEVKITTSFYKAKAKKNISRYHAKQKELERLEAVSVQKPRDDLKLKMQLDEGNFAARTLIRMEKVTFGFKEAKPLFHRMDLWLSRGDRLAVRGPNGAGKTTFVKLFMKKLIPQEGKIWHHPELKIGYFSQELEELDEETTLLDSLLRLPDMTQTHARTILGCFLFSREDVYKTIGDLSMGEKCRAAFLQLLFSGANLLVLDEPTNYLDVNTCEVIEDALEAYPGALVVISHDRTLVRKLSTRLLTLEQGQAPRIFEGTVQEEEEHLARRGGRAIHDADQDNRRVHLEWELSCLLSRDDGTEEENAERLLQIRKLRKELETL
ncbi:ribosomal protection-like ABC-F family protein [Paenibacillus sediminis]|uniref:ATP-binding cassette subfamily F protein 3 n=1 Tax=Paenibacillus sediminis TaxID=664909 RepID=A0ABS4H564_9BACL|nr:ABC-F type ribosomal protection protein [Paenibacillus sediminis]MBP1937512.1 ATP-binding cassette subfamily F protein 3 [Paenibacillus sediminis]